MFDRLGLGWGNSLLAFVALVLGTIYPIFLWYYVSLFPHWGAHSTYTSTQGEKIRARGKGNR